MFFPAHISLFLMAMGIVSAVMTTTDWGIHRIPGQIIRSILSSVVDFCRKDDNAVPDQANEHSTFQHSVGYYSVER